MSPGTKKRSSYERTYIEQNTLLGAFRSGTTPLVNPPVPPVPRHLHHDTTTDSNLQYQDPLERLSEIEIRSLGLSLDGDINWEIDPETDNNTEP